MNRPRSVGFAALLGLGLAACGSDDAAPDPEAGIPKLSLGLVIDQASASAFYSWPNAANLALSQINGGLAQAGANLRLVLQLNDTSQDATLATMGSIDLVRRRGAKAIITDTSKNGVAITKLMYDAMTDNDMQRMFKRRIFKARLAWNAVAAFV